MKATTQALSGIARLAIAARKPRIGKRSWVRPARRSFAVMGLLLQPPSGVTTPTAQLMCADGQSGGRKPRVGFGDRSEEHTSELQSLMRISYAVFCLKKKNKSSEK